jgi:ferredoxin-NADP reductase
MATPRTARIVAAAAVAADTRHLTVEMIEPARLDFVGGQYVIVDSGIVLPSGKAVKRAYSILSADADQSRFELATLRVPDGPGSGFIHEQPVGAEIRFSGPWGKLFLAAEVEQAERLGPSSRTLALATDTGVTAMLGLLRSTRFAPWLASCAFVWLRPSPSYFLPAPFVRARLPEGLGEVRVGELPPAGHPERVPFCRQLVRDLVASAPLARAFIAGDGLVNTALIDDLVAAGVPATRDNVESFFNMPKKADTLANVSSAPVASPKPS